MRFENSMVLYFYHFRLSLSESLVARPARRGTGGRGAARGGYRRGSIFREQRGPYQVDRRAQGAQQLPVQPQRRTYTHKASAAEEFDCSVLVFTGRLRVPP